jgi:two-component system, NarL family, nitrate/nitrite sensor histidine kinase NarX
MMISSLFSRLGKMRRLPAVIFISAWLLCFLLLFVIHHFAMSIFSSDNIVIVGLFSVAVTFATWLLQRSNQEQKTIENLHSEIENAQRRLNSVLKINRNLLDVQDEKGLMDQFLAGIAEISGAEYASYVPLDELEQPLPAFTFGPFSAPILKSWAEHLASEMVRHRCEICQGENRDESKPCPLLEGMFAENYNVFCLPVRRGNKSYGVLNIYLPISNSFPIELRHFLEGLVNEIGVAIQGIRLRNQEMATFRQLQKLRTSRSDLREIINNLLNNLKQTLELKLTAVLIQPDDRFPEGIQIFIGETWLEYYAKEKAKEIDKTTPIITLQVSEGNEKAILLFLPLLQSNGQYLGTMVAAVDQILGVDTALRANLHAFALQISLLLEIERSNFELSYELVINERRRLAREIHDGLAQILAYLKLQTAQMQHQLIAEDTQRLALTLQQHYAALTDAYVDVREAIDNLRLNPVDQMSEWISRIARNFHESSGISIKVEIKELDQNFPEDIQLQVIRIIQEAFSNIRKHAHAKSAWINVYRRGGDFILQIGDDGIGISAGEFPEVSQHGLKGMRERAELIGADFQIISTSGEGTVVQIRLPGIEEAPV